MPEQTAFPHRRVGLVEDHESVAIGVSVMLEIGREVVYGEAADEILAEAEAVLTDEAMA